MKKVFLVALLAAMAPLALVADGHDPIEQRQKMMKETREALKPMIGMTRGQVDFDADVVTNSLAVFAHTAANSGDLFPEGSETGFETEAKSTIWSDRDGFNQKMADFADAVTAAQESNPQSVDELKPALNGVLKTCKGCHDDYRVEKD